MRLKNSGRKDKEQMENQEWRLCEWEKEDFGLVWVCERLNKERQMENGKSKDKRSVHCLNYEINNRICE